MTKKRDLKRRVRERQTKTGESYVAARRQVLAAKPEPPADDFPEEPTQPGAEERVVADTPIHVVDALVPMHLEGGAVAIERLAAREALVRSYEQLQASPMSVVELIDGTAEATRLGLRCTVRVWPALAARVDVTAAITRLRDVVLATSADPAMAAFVAATIHGEKQARHTTRDFAGMKQFLRRARAGLGGVSGDGHMLAIPVATAGGLVTMVCSLHRDAVSLTIDSDSGDPFSAAGALATIAAIPALRVTVRAADGTITTATRLVSDGMVIGRGPTCDLRIRDGKVSRAHARVVRVRGAYHLTDLGSTNGVRYRGMRIDNKRIDDGDVFEVGGYEVRFSRA